jgi:hypothetical protein
MSQGRKDIQPDSAGSKVMRVLKQHVGRYVTRRYVRALAGGLSAAQLNTTLVDLTMRYQIQEDEAGNILYRGHQTRSRGDSVAAAIRRAREARGISDDAVHPTGMCE